MIAGQTALALAYHSMTREPAEVLLLTYAATLGLTLWGMDRIASGARQRLYGAGLVVACLSLVALPAAYGEEPSQPRACALAVLVGLIAMIFPERGSALTFRQRITAARVDLGAVLGFALSPVLVTALATALRA